MRSLVALGSFTIALALMTACGDDTSNAGGAGGETAEGGGGAPGTAGGGGTVDPTGGGGAGECLAFGTACEVGVDTCCDTAGETGECYAFGMGPKCTIPCPADPADCPNNGEGCNNMDPPVCKDP